MKEDQSEIYYILGDDYNIIRAASPEYFKTHIEVLYLTDTMDSFMLVGLQNYNGKPLRAWTTPV
jgi:HSP90 family molecular chaperone